MRGPVKILYKIICPMLSPSLVACALFQLWKERGYLCSYGIILRQNTPPQPRDVYKRQDL